MPLKCLMCDTELEISSQPDLDGHLFTVALCPKCGFEIGGADVPLTKEELKACMTLRHQLRNRGGATTES